MENDIIPKANRQIFNELDFCFKKYKLIPKVYISYDRYSYTARDDETFRITFDTNIEYRDKQLMLDEDQKNKVLMNDKMYMMEVKVANCMPIWFTDALTKLKIYPTSFSKYGSIYKKELIKEIPKKISNM